MYTKDGGWRWDRWVVAVLCCGVSSTATLRAAEPALTAYFDAVDRTVPPPTNFVLRVDNVIASGPAERAGMKVGDLIVGVDGWRTRGDDDFQYLRYLASSSRTIQYAVSRDGQWVDVKLSNAKPGRTGLFSTTTLASSSIHALVRWGVRIDPLPTYGNDPVTGEAIPVPDADAPDPGAAIARYGAGVQPWFALSDTVFRAREAFCELAAARRPGDREWVDQFIRAWSSLMLEDYGAAEKALTPLVARPTHPFLDAMARFHLRVAQEQVGWRGPDDWKRCGVDSAFFAICYPYPTLKQRHDSSFASRPSFQKAFDLKRGNTAESRDAMQTVRRMFMEPESDSAVDNYLCQVSRAILSEDDYGWPFRSSLVYRNPGRQTMLASLKQRLTEKPDDRTLTAVALLFPAMKEGDTRAFGQAAEILCQAGNAEAAVAARIVRQAANYWNLEAGEWRAAWEEAESKAVPRPAIYYFLGDRSPPIERRLAVGFFMEEARFEDVSHYCANQPWFVGEGLERPLNRNLLNVMVDAVLGPGLSKDAAADAFVRLAEMAARLPDDAGAYRALVELARNVPRDVVVKGLTDVAQGLRSVQYRSGSRAVGELVEDWSPWMAAVEEDALPKAVQAARQIAAGGDANERSRTVLPEIGIPSGAVVLAGAAQVAGDAETAYRLRRLAEDFYELQLDNQRPVAALWALRDFLAVPGFETQADVFRKVAVRTEDRRAYLLAALLALRQSNTEAAIQGLETARQRGVTSQTAPEFLLWEGERLTPEAFRDKLIATLRPLVATDTNRQRLDALAGN